VLQRREERPRADRSQVSLPLPVCPTLRPEIIQTRPTVTTHEAATLREATLAEDGTPAASRATITLRTL
jgi:hypothetical protein